MLGRPGKKAVAWRNKRLLWERDDARTERKGRRKERRRKRRKKGWKRGGCGERFRQQLG